MCMGKLDQSVLFCFVYTTLLKLLSLIVCTRRIHSARYAGVLPSLNDHSYLTLVLDIILVVPGW